MTSRRRPIRIARRRGATLVELVLSLVIAAMLLAGIASAMVIASRIIPAGGAPLRPVGEASFTLDRMLMELQGAKSVSELTSTAVTAVVPDLTGDKIDDTIRYSWSGVKDAPLLRQINGGAPTEAIGSVRGFALGYAPFSKTSTKTTVSTTVSGTQTISSFSFWAGLTVPVTQNWNLSTTEWAAIQFNPLSTVPYNAKSMSITGVDYTIRNTGVAGTVVIGVYPTGAANTYPSTPLIGSSVSIASGAFGGSYGSRSTSFSDVTIDNPFAGYVIRFHATGGLVANLKALYGTVVTPPANDTIGEWSANSGTSWSPLTADINKYDVPHTIYGTYTTETRTRTTETRYYLRSITAAAALSDGSAVQLASPLPNEPDVTGLWSPAVDSGSSLFDVIVGLVGNVLRL